MRKKLLIYAVGSDLKETRKLYLGLKEQAELDIKIMVNKKTELVDSIFVDTSNNRHFVSSSIFNEINKYNPDFIIIDSEKQLLAGVINKAHKEKIVSVGDLAPKEKKVEKDNKKQENKLKFKGSEVKS